MGMLTDVMENTLPLGFLSHLSNLWLGLGAECSNWESLAPDFLGWGGTWLRGLTRLGSVSILLPSLLPAQTNSPASVLPTGSLDRIFFWRTDVDTQKTFDNYQFRSLPVLIPWCSKIRELASDMSKPSTQGGSLDSRDGCCPIGGGTPRPEWTGGRPEYTLIFERKRDFKYSYSRWCY